MSELSFGYSTFLTVKQETSDWKKIIRGREDHGMERVLADRKQPELFRKRSAILAPFAKTSGKIGVSLTAL